jgi:uncharacterized membrane protein
MDSLGTPTAVTTRASHPFRGAVFRGLGVVLPPLLTIVIFLWIGGTVEHYVLAPVVQVAETILVRTKADIRGEDAFPPSQRGQAKAVLDGVEYQRLERGEYVPKADYDLVVHRLGEEPVPKTGALFYAKYFRLFYLRPYLVIPTFVLLFTLLLYLLGKFMAAGIGRFFWRLIEGGIERLPLVRNVYSAVKQVSGFLLNERELRVSRVVAVEYPRPGVWALGFVMGEGMAEIERFVGEECVTVMICTSPMPMAGFTITIRRSEAIDLNLTLDQAIQFIVSCGVVIPPKPLLCGGPLRPRLATPGSEAPPEPTIHQES